MGISLDWVAYEYEEPIPPAAGTWIAFCGPSYYAWDSTANTYQTITFHITFNTYYENGPFTEAEWTSIIVHELGHALGIGVFWEKNGDWIEGTGGKYPRAGDAYNLLTASTPLRGLIPIESEGPAGTAGFHWEDDDRLNIFEPPGNDGYVYSNCMFDIMVAFFTRGGRVNISELSIGFLLDIGYARRSSASTLQAIADMQSLSTPELRAQSEGEIIEFHCGKCKDRFSQDLKPLIISIPDKENKDTP